MHLRFRDYRMGYKYQEIDVEKWCEITVTSGTGVFGGKEFLLATAHTYNYNLIICLITFNEKPILSVPFFTKKNEIIYPNHYFYQFFWEVDSEKESWLVLDAWDVLLRELQRKFSTIKLKLPISVTDCRPFIWNDFSVSVKYTYTKKLNDLSYHLNIQRILKKQIPEYSFKKNCDWEENWNFHRKDLIGFGIRQVTVDSYIEYLKALKEQSLVQVFNAYHNNMFLTSIVVIQDKGLNYAYLPLIGTAEGHYNSGLPSVLYDYTFRELKLDGVEVVDLLGANIKTISKFKSKFLPDLQSYHEVSYSASDRKMKQVVLDVKEFVKKFLS